jgi:hypothetical protein
MTARRQGSFGVAVLAASFASTFVLSACSLDLRGRGDAPGNDPGATPSSGVVPGGDATSDGGTAAPTVDASALPALPDGSLPPPTAPLPGATCGSAQCSGAPSDICCIDWSASAGVTRACTSDSACNGARLACDAPSDCPGAVCCLAHALDFGDELPKTQCESKCGDEKNVVCDPTIGCPGGGTCTLHLLLGVHYCR